MNQTQSSVKSDDSYGNIAEARDGMSWIDLAKLIAKRWKSMLMIFLLILALAVAYAFLAPKKYSYASLYNVAEQAPTESNPNGFLEQPGAVANRVQSVYLAQSVRATLVQEQIDDMPFEIDVSTPNGSTVMVTTEASESDAQAVAAIHKAMLEKAQASQQKVLERRRNAIETQLQNARQSLESIRERAGDDSGDAIFRYVTLVAELEADLSLLQDGQISEVAQRGLKPVSVGRAIILAFGVILGGVLGVLGVFLLEFASIVRKALVMEKHLH